MSDSKINPKKHAPRPGEIVRVKPPDKVKASVDLLLKHSVSAIGIDQQADLSQSPVKVLKSPLLKLALAQNQETPAQKQAMPARQVGSSPARIDSQDISAAIHGHARKVRTADLAAKHQELEVVRMGDVLRLVQEAVDEAVKNSERDFNEHERRRLLEEAEDHFNERLKSFKAEKADLEAQAKHFKDQLEKAQGFLEEERRKVVSANQFTVSDAGLIELEKRLSRLLDHAILRGGASADLQNEMRTVVAKLLDDEREKISQKAKDAQSEAISLLERKIQRLASSLDETQKARQDAEERARLLESAKGNFVLQNIYKPGLNEKDPRKEKKLNLLKDIALNNREIRQHIEKMEKSTMLQKEEDLKKDPVAVP